jgi:hypothetical protein
MQHSERQGILCDLTQSPSPDPHAGTPERGWGKGLICAIIYRLCLGVPGKTQAKIVVMVIGRIVVVVVVVVVVGRPQVERVIKLQLALE